MCWIAGLCFIRHEAFNFLEDKPIPHLCASLPECSEFLRFTSGVTPADFLTASIAADRF